MPTELPSVSWFAEHAMGWIKQVESDLLRPEKYFVREIWVDALGKRQAFVSSWDPLTNEADALQLWEHVVPNPKRLDWSLTERVFAVWADRAVGGDTVREAICRAVEAYVLARAVHNTGTD